MDQTDDGRVAERSRTHVVPPATVETGRVLAEFIDDLIHLEGCRQSFDELAGKQKIVVQREPSAALKRLVKGGQKVICDAQRSPGSFPASA